MKVFFISLPFDLENSGDYDYCTTLVTALRKLNIDSHYIKGQDIQDYNSQLANDLLSTISAKNKGGDNFYKSLKGFYESGDRQQLVGSVITHLQEMKGNDHEAIVNLQLRAPETGFLFSPSDLEQLREEGFKICITCHEYKLNYSRRWLQSIMHPYFEAADLVLFFNRKDMHNANKHAARTAFLEDQLFNLDSIPQNSIEQKHLIHSFSSQDQLSFSNLNHDIPSLFVTKQQFSSLRCEMLLGEVKYEKGAEIRYTIDGVKTRAKPPITLEWGVRKNIDISIKEGKETLTVSGIIIAPKPSDEIDSIPNKTGKKFYFDHAKYNLSDKSKLTKVPPTTANIQDYNLEEFCNKQPNIAIFGLIREGKGYEEAIHIIEYMHENYKETLPNTRLIIIGKAISYDLLAKIINKKFAIDIKAEIITGEILQDISHLEYEMAEVEIQKILMNIVQYKKSMIQKSLIKVNSYVENIEDHIFSNLLKNTHSLQVDIDLQSNLQSLIRRISENVPEALPIDIFLDVPQEELPKIFAHTKYAIKYDEKGWANNASGLINLLCYGTILYTNWGICTDSEITRGDYMVLPRGKYCLKVGESLSPEEEISEKRINNFKNPDSKKSLPIEIKKRMVTAEDIIKDIITREGIVSEEQKEWDFEESALYSSRDNRLTFEHIGELLQQFDPSSIAGDMISYFHELFQ